MNSWADIDAVRAEWPAEQLDPTADLAAWREGMQLYDSRDDYASMIRSGALMCRALRHEVYGAGILFETDLPNTVHRVLFASAFPPPDRQSFPQSVAAQLRLGLTVVKRYGWQPAEWGGNGLMGEFLTASFMVLSMAVAPSQNRLWEGDLKGFFMTHPIGTIEPPTPATTTARHAEFDDVIGSIQRSVDDADQGDPAGEARVKGMAAALAGDNQTALAYLEEAGRLGDTDAMYDAGHVAQELGLRAQMLYWWETAGQAGHGAALFNIGALHNGEGRRDEARGWYERAVQAGEPNGYAALTQLADEDGDDAAELHWSRLGAEAGQPFCQMRYGQLLMRSHPQDRVVIPTRVVPLLTEAADAGQEGALFLLGIAYGQLGDMDRARAWLVRAQAAGDPDAGRIMRENGLL